MLDQQHLRGGHISGKASAMQQDLLPCQPFPSAAAELQLPVRTAMIVQSAIVTYCRQHCSDHALRLMTVVFSMRLVHPWHLVTFGQQHSRLPKLRNTCWGHGLCNYLDERSCRATALPFAKPPTGAALGWPPVIPRYNKADT